MFQRQKKNFVLALDDVEAGKISRQLHERQLAILLTRAAGHLRDHAQNQHLSQ